MHKGDNIKSKLDLNKATLVFLDRHYHGGNVYRSGIGSLDERMIFKKDTVNLIGARSGEGKTRFLLYLILRFIKSGHKVFYVTSEDSTENLNIKFLEMETNLEPGRLFEKKEPWDNIKSKIINASKNFQVFNDRFFFMNVGRLKINKVVEIMHTASGLGVDVFIYDYLQTIAVEGINDTYRVNSTIAETIRQKTLELNLCTFGVVQLNRQADATLNNAPPSMSHVLGSGFYEQVAHNIILIKRKREKGEDGVFYPTNKIELHLAKNRLIGKLGCLLVDQNYKEIYE